MKLKMTIEVKECPACGRTKDRNGNPLKHGGKGKCKACYIKHLRQSSENQKTHDVARRIFQNALRKGEVMRATECSHCGSNVDLEAHHEDYAKPLEVVWLCRNCHEVRHLKVVDNKS